MNKLIIASLFLCGLANAPLPYEDQVKGVMGTNTPMFEAFSQVMKKGIEDRSKIKKIIKHCFDKKLIFFHQFFAENARSIIYKTIDQLVDEKKKKEFNDILTWCVFDYTLSSNPYDEFEKAPDRFMEAYTTILSIIPDKQRQEAIWAGNFFAIYYLKYLEKDSNPLVIIQSINQTFFELNA